MKYTQFNNTYSSVGALGETDDIKELCRDLVRYNGVDRKVQQPLVKWGVFDGCRRLKKDLLELHCIEVEHDAGTMGLMEAGGILHDKGFPLVGYETWSHTEGCPRWRIVLPLEKPLTIKDLGSVEGIVNVHSGFVNRLAQALGDGILSRESWRVAQCWYFGHKLGVSNPVLISNL